MDPSKSSSHVQLSRFQYYHARTFSFLVVHFLSSRGHRSMTVEMIWIPRDLPSLSILVGSVRIESDDVDSSMRTTGGLIYVVSAGARVISCLAISKFCRHN